MVQTTQVKKSNSAKVNSLLLTRYRAFPGNKDDIFMYVLAKLGILLPFDLGVVPKQIK